VEASSEEEVLEKANELFDEAHALILRFLKNVGKT
jgi:hypothetical protein